jgi:ArsR family transcriptional regulator, arsenate/arsenite/antimonite-responsive transcriptional repressor
MKDAAAILSLLAEPTCLAALGLLRDGQEHCACELMAALDATQSRMSRHMSALRDAGLVVDRRDAQWVRYRLNPRLPAQVRRLLDAALDLADATERRAA